MKRQIIVNGIDCSPVNDDWQIQYKIIDNGFWDVNRNSLMSAIVSAHLQAGWTLGQFVAGDEGKVYQTLLWNAEKAVS